MSNNMFLISSLAPETFAALFSLTGQELELRGAQRLIADRKPGYPCRVTLEDAEPGETVILASFAHQATEGSPYRASGPVFVRQSATSPAVLAPGDVPPMLRTRMLSVRAYDARGLLAGAEVTAGTELEAAIQRLLLDRPEAAYLHVHFAGPGCYACRVDRAPATSAAEPRAGTA